MATKLETASLTGGLSGGLGSKPWLGGRLGSGGLGSDGLGSGPWLGGRLRTGGFGLGFGFIRYPKAVQISPRR